jgi:hypothetical protein
MKFTVLCLILKTSVAETHFMSGTWRYLAKCINLLHKRVWKFPTTLEDKGLLGGNDCHALGVKGNSGKIVCLCLWFILYFMHFSTVNLYIKRSQDKKVLLS